MLFEAIGLAQAAFDGIARNRAFDSPGRRKRHTPALSRAPNNIKKLTPLELSALKQHLEQLVAAQDFPPGKIMLAGKLIRH